MRLSLGVTFILIVSWGFLTQRFYTLLLQYVSNNLCGGFFSALCFLPCAGVVAYCTGPDCHVLMKCLLPVAAPGHIQLNHTALVYAFTNNGPTTVHTHTHTKVLLTCVVYWCVVCCSYLCFVYLLLGEISASPKSTSLLLIGDSFEIYSVVYLLVSMLNPNCQPTHI